MPEGSPAAAATSTLSKVEAWVDVIAAARADGGEPALLHHADWLASLLTGASQSRRRALPVVPHAWLQCCRLSDSAAWLCHCSAMSQLEAELLGAGQRDATDWNNALKLGFDCERLCYPPAFAAQPWASALPSRVLEPGATMAPVAHDVIVRAGLHEGCEVTAGTTDSIAAFLAAGAVRVGDAVTSLGSTLAIKLLSKLPVQDKQAGVYSHRLGTLMAPLHECDLGLIPVTFTRARVSHHS